MCGVIGVYSLKDKTKNIYPLVVKGLLDLQHRGQLSAGITSYNPERKRILQTHKKNGKVHDVFEISRTRLQLYSNDLSMDNYTDISKAPCFTKE